MRIREATQADAQPFRNELLVPGFRETAAVAPEYSELDEAEVADAGIDRWLGDDDRALFVAEADGGLAGYVSGGRHDSPAIYARGPYANVDGLYVKPAFRRDGLAGRLLDRFEAWAAERGCEYVGVSAHVENGAALALYDDRYERTYVSYRGRLGDE